MGGAQLHVAFAAQRISVAVQISLAQEIAEALGLSVAADPRESAARGRSGMAGRDDRWARPPIGIYRYFS